MTWDLHCECYTDKHDKVTNGTFFHCSQIFRKGRPPERHVSPRCHELRPAGVCHPLHTRNQRPHTGGDLQRAGQEVSRDLSWTWDHKFCQCPTICLTWNVFFFFSVIWHRKPFKVPLFKKRRPPSGAQQGLMDSGSSGTSKEIPAGLHWRGVALAIPLETNDLKDNVRQDSESGEWKSRNDTIQVLWGLQCVNMEKILQCSFITNFWFQNGL